MTIHLMSIKKEHLGSVHLLRLRLTWCHLLKHIVTITTTLRKVRETIFFGSQKILKYKNFISVHHHHSSSSSKRDSGYSGNNSGSSSQSSSINMNSQQQPPVAHAKNNLSSSSNSSSWNGTPIYHHHLHHRQHQQATNTTPLGGTNSINNSPIGNSQGSQMAAVAAALLQPAPDLYAQTELYRRPTVFVSQGPYQAYNRVVPPPAHNAHNGSSRQVIRNHPFIVPSLFCNKYR